MLNLTPVEHTYLSSPFLSDGEELLKLTLQHLCLIKVIDIEERWISINRRERRKRKRFFFMRGEQFGEYSTSKEGENFILNLLSDRDEFRFYELRHHIKSEFGKKGVDHFKKACVYPDLKSAGLISWSLFPSKKAKAATKETNEIIEQINANIDKLLLHDHAALQKMIGALGSKIILLESDTIDKLEGFSDNIQDIEDLNFLAILNTSFTTLDSIFYSSYGGFSSFSDFSSGSTFGGFGGGDFGGGGAGGDW